jgi:hypothetical protein
MYLFCPFGQSYRSFSKLFIPRILFILTPCLLLLTFNLFTIFCNNFTYQFILDELRREKLKSLKYSYSLKEFMRFLE